MQPPVLCTGVSLGEVTCGLVHKSTTGGSNLRLVYSCTTGGSNLRSCAQVYHWGNESFLGCMTLEFVALEALPTLTLHSSKLAIGDMKVRRLPCLSFAFIFCAYLFERNSS